MVINCVIFSFMIVSHFKVLMQLILQHQCTLYMYLCL